MRYWMSKDWSLHSWKDTGVFAVCENGREVPLSLEERLFLLHCDGREVEPAKCAEKLVRQGIITSERGLEQVPKLEQVPGTCSNLGTGGRRERSTDFEPSPAFHVHDYLHRTTAVIGITGRCNYQCRHCIAATGTSQERDELTFEEIDSLFSQMPELGIRKVWLTGGEPLIHPRFLDIIDAATSHGIRIARILTNGSLLSADVLEHLAMRKQRPQFGISFDGLGTHDWMRCAKGAEEASLRAIDLARAHGFEVNPHINVNNITAPRLIESCRHLVMQHGCKSLRLIPTSRSPRWEAMAKEGDNISYDDYFELMLKLIRVAHDEKWDVELDLRSLPQIHNKQFRHLLPLLKEPPAVRESKPIMHGCSRTKSQIFIAHDGRVLPCNAYEGTTKQYGFLVGDDINIRKRPLKDILTASEFSHVCTETMADHLRDCEKCRACKWLSVCNGGCPLFALGNRMKLARENPNCAFFLGGWAERYIAEILAEVVSE